MKLASQKLLLVVASAAIVLAGCAKKPIRPTPDLTGPIGPPPPMQQSNTGPTNTNFGGLGLEGLQQRSPYNDRGEDPEALRTQTIYFDFDQSVIKPAERTKLKIAKEYLDKNPTHRLILEGRCDWHGTAEYNLALGDRRANAVKKYLQSLGVAADRLETRSKGSLEASKTANDAERAKDRRVDLIALNPSAAAAMRPPGAL